MGHDDRYYFSYGGSEQGGGGYQDRVRPYPPPEPWSGPGDDRPYGTEDRRGGAPRGRDQGRPPTSKEVERVVQELRKTVERHFRISDVKWNEESAAFFFQNLPMDLDERFEALRKDLKRSGFVPFLKEDKGEYVLYLNKKPKMDFKSPKVNLVMFFLTIFTTIWAGSILWAGYKGVELSGLSDYVNILSKGELVLFGGLSFALPLMLILGTHELGHYTMSRRYNVDASLPFFIPVPPVFPLGTLGAFISLREPIPNRRALLVIGAAGPIVGFLVAIPIIFLGFFLSIHYPQEQITSDGGVFLVLRNPLLYAFFAELMPVPADTAMHPMAFAGWVGLFVTALNLLPAGQLDGGHIARATLGGNAKYVSYATVFFLLGAGIYTGFGTWLLFGILIMLLGANHPPPLNDLGTLETRHKVIGIFTVVMLVLTFHPAPIAQVEIEPPHYELELSTSDTFWTVDSPDWSHFEITMINWGDEADTYNITLEARTFGPDRDEPTSVDEWDVGISYDDEDPWDGVDVEWEETHGDMEVSPDVALIELEPEEEMVFMVGASPGNDVAYGEWIEVALVFYSDGKEEVVSRVNLTTIKATVSLNAKSRVFELSVSGGGDFTIRNELEVMNIGDQDDAIQLEVKGQPNLWDVSLNTTEVVLNSGESVKVKLEVTPASDEDSDVELLSVEVPIRVTARSSEISGSQSFVDIILKFNFG